MKNEIKREDYTRHEEAYLKATYPAYTDMKPLSRAQADALFAEHAVYVRYDGDCMPLHIALQLFGYEPVQRALQYENARYASEAADSKPYTSSAGARHRVLFLTERGFNVAVNDFNAYTCSLAQVDYHAAADTDFDEFDAADQAMLAEEEAKRKAAAEKRRMAQKKAADSSTSAT